MLFLTGAVVGVFTAQDLLLFYAFFEAMMIPLYVLVGVWGGPGRMAATLKFVLFTMAGSLLMLASIVVYGLSQNTFDLVEIGQSSSNWIFLGFVAAFAIKAPLFPLHGWLPDAYRESSPEVAGILSGVVSKAAAYGFLRIAIAKFPEPTQHYRAAILALAAVGLIYGSLLAFRAPDIRGVIAYSSLAQMGLITMGVFSVNDLGLDGSVLLMVNHGLVSTTLFLLAGMVERRTLTGELARLGGMARGRPILATVLLTTGVIALAVPLSSAFAGEFLVLAGVFRHGWAGPWSALWQLSSPRRTCCAWCRRFSIATSELRCPMRRSTFARRSSASSCRSWRVCSHSRRGPRRSRSTRSVTTTARPTWLRASSDPTAAHRLVRARACQFAAGAPLRWPSSALSLPPVAHARQ